MKNTKPLGLAMMATKGITSIGGDKQFEGYLVTLGDDGKLPSGVMPTTGQNAWWNTEATDAPTAPGYQIKDANGKALYIYADANGTLWIR